MTRKPPRCQHHVYGKSAAIEVYDSLAVTTKYLRLLAEILDISMREVQM